MVLVVVLAVFVARISWRSVSNARISVEGFKAVEAHAPLLREAARESRVDPNLLAGIMLAESTGRVNAESSAGALGLFQLMLPTARERAQLLGFAEPTRDELLSNAELNTRLAADYVQWLQRRYHGDIEQTLVAYNAGPGKLERWIKDAGSYDSWRSEREAAGDSQVLAYASKVMRYRERFAERGVVAPSFDFPPGKPARRAQAPPTLATTLPTTPIPYGPIEPPTDDAHDVPPIDDDL